MFRKKKSSPLRPWLQPWQGMDWYLLGAVLALTALGGVMVHSVQLAHTERQDWIFHLLIGSVGMVLVFVLARLRYDALLPWKWWIYGITNVSLLLVMIMGLEAKGAQRWLGLFGFGIQPSEFAKLGAIITLAAVLHQRSASTIPMMVKVLGIAALPWVLIFLQPNLGTSLVFGAITIGMLYWGNANPGWLLLLLSPVISAVLFTTLITKGAFGIGAIGLWVVVVGLVAWKTLPWKTYGTLVPVVVNLIAGGLGQVLWQFVLHDYQKARILMFIDPDQDPLGAGYHLIQSRIAIGAGELTGRGLFRGTQTQLDFIPEQHTDFIFTAIGEELGFLGSIFVLGAYLLICYRLLIIAQNAKDEFGALITVGVFSMIIFQVSINIGMTINLSPVTGIPLPWLSHGNAALLMNFMAIGLVESVANFRQKPKF
ncbi:rod shape-determining protein RodA [Leptolyngbya sp. NIES-2104]|uniref:rod shape-determining protein RodA n=1 Tax=Leptolyngbya sp. NIES-2104 TaxID=1552121 RepID=UPI0006EC45D2|nr:rod shape-determining protein RodA [Leptolyngbya sp. NIES-2104]GAP97438.1 rod shape-determining protein RodA [Leptolyngbya sp. NIES-2104]